MEDAVPSLPRVSYKKPVVVILADSIIALDPSQGGAITHYIDPILRRLSESNYLREPPLVAFVTYDPLRSNGASISVTEFSPFDAQRKLEGIPAGQTIAGDPLGMLTLDGYVDALKLIDHFQSGSGQGSKEQFSYHLLHIAAGQHDGAETSRCDFSPTLWDVRWETIPDEITKRDINFSMILLSPCPKFSGVFYAISPTPIEPWFPKCPRHTILLSGFASSPERGAKIPPRIPAKRPAEDPAEKDCPRSRPRRAFSEPTPAPALASVKTQPKTVDQWLGTLIWHREESDVRLQVLAVDMVRPLNTATLPTSLRVEIFESGTNSRDIQAYIREKKAPMARIKYACETNAHEFKDLVKSLHKSKAFAIARCDAQGKDSHHSNLLLAPLNEDLLCAILPTSNLQDLPKARPEPPPEEGQPEVDYPPPAETSPLTLGNTECLRMDPLCPHPAAFAMRTLDFQQIPPQQSQYPRQQQHPPPYHSQEQLSQPHAQQCQQPASSDTSSALLPDGVNVNSFDSGFSCPLTENGACVDLGQTYPTATLEFGQMPPQQSQLLLLQQQQQQHPPPYDYRGQLSQPQYQQPPSPDTPPTLPDGVNSFDSDPLTENDAYVGFIQAYGPVRHPSRIRSDTFLFL